jgi:hypothetical protein
MPFVDYIENLLALIPINTAQKIDAKTAVKYQCQK